MFRTGNTGSSPVRVTISKPCGFSNCEVFSCIKLTRSIIQFYSRQIDTCKVPIYKASKSTNPVRWYKMINSINSIYETFSHILTPKCTNFIDITIILWKYYYNSMKITWHFEKKDDNIVNRIPHTSLAEMLDCAPGGTFFIEVIKWHQNRH